MQWFRLYTDMVDDPKILGMSDAQFRGWIHLLCLAGRENERGFLQNSPKFLAKSMRISEKKLKNLLDFFETDVGIIKLYDDKIVINSWEKRNPKSDNGAERMRLHRSKCNVTELSHKPSQSRNSDVAIRSDQIRSDQIRSEKPSLPPEISSVVRGTIFDCLTEEVYRAWRTALSDDQILYALSDAIVKSDLSGTPVLNPLGWLRAFVKKGEWMNDYNRPRYQEL